MTRSQCLAVTIFLPALVLSSFLIAQDDKGKTPSKPASKAAVENKLSLREGWTLQTSAKVEAKGEAISTPQFATQGWHQVTVPTTVVAALVKDKTLAEPFFGMNLRNYPGMNYPIGANFSNIPMAADSPYAVSWWYRKAFTLPASDKGKTVWLKFNGINYRANIFLNGKQIANPKRHRRRLAHLRIQRHRRREARRGKCSRRAGLLSHRARSRHHLRRLEPRASRQEHGTVARSLLTTSGPVALRYPTVVSKVSSPANDSAQLTVTAQLKNGTSQPVKGKLKGQIENITFEQDVELAANEAKDVTFAPDKFSQLIFTASAPVVARADGQAESLSAAHAVRSQRHGQRSARKANSAFAKSLSELNAIGGRAFHINGKNILIRGGGWTPDMMLRENSQRMNDEFRYVAGHGPEHHPPRRQTRSPEFFDMADQQGILVMAGWCCCDFWERWPKWQPKDFEIAKQSLRDQIYRLRSHPAIVMWLNGSDNPPPPDVEQMYLDVEKDLLWPNPTVSSATGKKTSVTGDSGVKMSGPYEYVAPSYWQRRHARRPARPQALQPRWLRRRIPLQHRNQHGAGRSADREHPDAWSAKITCGRSTTPGTTTRAAANSKPSASSPTRSRTATANPTTWKTSP